MAVLGVDFDADLVDERRVEVDCLEFLRSDELTVLQLLELFDSVDNLNSAVGQHHDEVADAEPAVLVEHLGSEVGILEVALHDAVAFDVELAAWQGRSGIGVQFGHFSDLHSDAGKNAANVSGASLPVSGASAVS